MMGFVMALTIPTLIQNTNKAAYVDGLKKTYGILDQATTQIMLNNSGTLKKAFTNADDIVTKYCNILECNKTCGDGTAVSGGCYNAQSAIKSLHNDAYWNNPTDAIYRSFVLADGTLVLTRLMSTDCTGTEGGILSSICGWFTIDVNGFNGPNIYGRDIFAFYIKQDKISPAGETGDFVDYDTYCNPTSSDVYSGIGCAQKVLNEQDMSY
jgi:hypothetical protein